MYDVLSCAFASFDGYYFFKYSSSANTGFNRRCQQKSFVGEGEHVMTFSIKLHHDTRMMLSSSSSKKKTRSKLLNL